jgi:hypothetical protein
MSPRIYLAGLLATWNERDFLYRRRAEKGKLLTRAEISAILANRRSEADQLQEPERGLALQALREWRP